MRGEVTREELRLLALVTVIPALCMLGGWALTAAVRYVVHDWPDVVVAISLMVLAGMSFGVAILGATVRVRIVPGGVRLQRFGRAGGNGAAGRRGGGIAARHRGQPLQTSVTLAGVAPAGRRPFETTGETALPNRLECGGMNRCRVGVGR